MCVSHRKTRKLRRIQRKPRREGTSHWLSSSQIVWTRTVHPARGATEEEEKERMRPVEAGWSCSSRITSGQRITATVAGYHKWIRHGLSRSGISSFRCSQSHASMVFTRTDSKGPSTVHQGLWSLIRFALPVAAIRVCAWVTESSLAAEGRGRVIACLYRTWPCPGVIQSTLDHFFAWCLCGGQK